MRSICSLLAPAAIHLRRLWSNDLCGFADATLALWRLQQLLRQYSGEFRAETERQETGHRALLAPTPREKHELSYAMFCLVLMSEFFRRDGWEAWIEPDPTTAEFAHVIHEQWFDVVEFLVSGDKQLDALALTNPNDPTRIAESIDRSHGLRSGVHRASRVGLASRRGSHGNRRETGGASGSASGGPDGSLLVRTGMTNNKVGAGG